METSTFRWIKINTYLTSDPSNGSVMNGGRVDGRNSVDDVFRRYFQKELWPMPQSVKPAGSLKRWSPGMYTLASATTTDYYYTVCVYRAGPWKWMNGIMLWAQGGTPLWRPGSFFYRLSFELQCGLLTITAGRFLLTRVLEREREKKKDGRRPKSPRPVPHPSYKIRNECNYSHRLFDAGKTIFFSTIAGHNKDISPAQSGGLQVSCGGRVGKVWTSQQLPQKGRKENHISRRAQHCSGRLRGRNFLLSSSMAARRVGMGNQQKEKLKQRPRIGAHFTHGIKEKSKKRLAAGQRMAHGIRAIECDGYVRACCESAHTYKTVGERMPGISCPTGPDFFHLRLDEKWRGAEGI